MERLWTNIILLFSVLTISLNFCSIAQQTHYFSDHFRGGVTGGGYNPSNFIFTGQIDLNIPISSSIRKAFLFSSATKHYNVTDFPEPRVIYINGQSVNVSMADALNNYYKINDQFNQPIYEMRTIVVDITPLALSSVINITPPSQVLPPFYWEYYVLVLYEDNSLPYTTIDVFINNQDADSLMNYSLNSSMAIDINNDVGLAINTSHFCDTIQDGSYVYIEGNEIGLIGGDDYNVPTTGGCAGATGGFFYENNILFGLGDDTPDEFMSGSDVLANIKNYIIDNQQIAVQFEYQSDLGPKSNPINQFFLTYTSNCEPFDVSTTNDTTLCLDANLQLNASGGQSYEWLPATGLSCSDCPNPVFTADSSMFYTVRIWNNDTCSVVRPLKINVRPRTEFGALATTPSECGANNGTVTLNALPSNGIVTYWQEVGGATQTSNVFQNLSTGNHTFFFIDTNGCQSADTIIFVEEINSTSASFSVSPQTGAVPLTVEFTNTSLNATNFEWFLEDVSMGSSFPNYEFSSSGTYEIMLVSWQNDPSCADTALQSVVIYDSLMISVPNVFTPNGDGVNDFFEITNSLPVHCELVIVNRWGNIMYEFSDNLSAGSTKLWDGYSLLFHGDMIEGTYFYDVTFSGANQQTLELEKLGILPIKKSGFVEVRR